MESEQGITFFTFKVADVRVRCHVLFDGYGVGGPFSADMALVLENALVSVHVALERALQFETLATLQAVEVVALCHEGFVGWFHDCWVGWFHDWLVGWL